METFLRSYSSSGFRSLFSIRSFTSFFHFETTVLQFRGSQQVDLHFFWSSALLATSLFSQCFIFFNVATIPVCCRSPNGTTYYFELWQSDGNRHEMVQNIVQARNTLR